MASLNGDVLCEIALHLASKSRDLKDLRSVSQVCQPWRNIVIKFATPWARSLYFSSLHNSDWRRVVLERTKDADLHMTCQYLTNAFLTVAEDNWERIAHLEVEWSLSSGFVAIEDLEDRICRLVSRPAPAMVCFRFPVWIIGGVEGKLRDSGLTMFGSQAPRLVDYKAKGLPVDVQRTTLTNIQYLTLSTPVAVSTLLLALDDMKQLRHLEVSSVLPQPETDRGLRSVTMPNLTRLVILGKGQHSTGPIELLVHLNPSHDHHCTLVFRSGFPVDLLEGLCAPLGAKLVAFARHAFTREGTEVRLVMDDNRFCLLASTEGQTVADLQLYMIGAGDRNVHGALLDMFTTASWSGVAYASCRALVPLSIANVRQLLMALCNAREVSLQGGAFYAVPGQLLAALLPGLCHLQVDPQRDASNE